MHFYKFITSKLISILFTFGKRHKILHPSQEDFRPMRNTARQIQATIAALKDANFTNKDTYLTYIP